MKRISAIVGLAVICGLTTSALFAQGSASGAIHVKDDAGQAINIEFNARAKGGGAGEGVLTFSGQTSLADPDTENGGSSTNLGLSMKVDLDCLVVNQNQAAMSGIVRDSSVEAYRGKRVLLAVEDGGEGSKAAPDKFTFGSYQLQAMNWFPTDAEVPNDNGWKFTWIATDAERPDDRGVPISRSTDVDCRSFSLSAYGYVDIPQGSGNVQVRP